MAHVGFSQSRRPLGTAKGLYNRDWEGIMKPVRIVSGLWRSLLGMMWRIWKGPCKPYKAPVYNGKPENPQPCCWALLQLEPLNLSTRNPKSDFRSLDH